jgi:hypothetical protein
MPSVRRGPSSRNANATVQCPVEKGPYTVSQTVELPNEIPRGVYLTFDIAIRVYTTTTELTRSLYVLVAKFQVAVRGYNQDEEDMLCLDLFVDFMKGRH